jgi:SET domain-containing protein
MLLMLPCMAMCHFINHACDPNCGIYAVWINCLDLNIPCLALFSLRDISINEEITFDYSLNKANQLSSYFGESHYDLVC